MSLAFITKWGGHKIGPGFDGECSAPTVTDRRGNIVGVYIDDTTPDIRTWVAKAVAKYPDGIVFVALSPFQRHTDYEPHPAVVELYETYWWGMDYDASEILPLPQRAGYIVQWGYMGTRGSKPPPLVQRLAWLARVIRKRPKYVFAY